MVFFAQATSYAISGGLATIADVPRVATPIESLKIYDHAFIVYGFIAVALTLISLLLVPFLNKMIGNEK